MAIIMIHMVFHLSPRVVVAHARFYSRLIFFTPPSLHTLALLKYTDVDYNVVSDGAKFVLDGMSPYDRPTYRYTPFLAWLLVPNHVLHSDWGKLLFCAADLLCGYLILLIGRTICDDDSKSGTAASAEKPAKATAARGKAVRGGSSTGTKQHQKGTQLPSQPTDHALLWSVAVWLLNPLTINVSTRGNSESLVCASVLLTLLAAVRRWPPFAVGALLGLAVHVKVYPIIYAWPLLLHTIVTSQSSQTRQRNAFGCLPGWLGSATRLLAGCAVVLALITGLAWVLYGEAFLDAWLLYHVRRQDAKHNFSLFFLGTYLNSVATAAAGGGAAGALQRLASKALQIIPQLAVVVGTGWRFHESAADLCFGLFIQTFAFVAFNRVCTVQYFMWWLCLMAVCVPWFRWSAKRRWIAALVASLWTGAHGAWGMFAYALEFEGRQAFVHTWAASVAIFVANITVITLSIVLYDPKLKRQ